MEGVLFFIVFIYSKNDVDVQKMLCPGFYYGNVDGIPGVSCLLCYEPSDNHSSFLQYCVVWHDQIISYDFS